MTAGGSDYASHSAAPRHQSYNLAPAPSIHLDDRLDDAIHVLRNHAESDPKLALPTRADLPSTNLLPHGTDRLNPPPLGRPVGWRNADGSLSDAAALEASHVNGWMNVSKGGLGVGLEPSLRLTGNILVLYSPYM